LSPCGPNGIADYHWQPVPELRPFRGLRYDPARVPDLSSVLCPPYDVISPAERQALLARDEHNAVRIELPSATPASATDADFAAAAATLGQWLDDGTLTRDARPMIYVYEQQYTAADGTPRVARSFFAELRIEEYGPHSGVRPHERTLGPAKEHRYQLLTATRTDLSAVLLVYEADTTALLDAIVATARPDEAIGPDGVGQRLWHIDPELVPQANDLLAVAGAGPLTIADGHHRYETALRYRDSAGAPAGADHVLALLYSAQADGLGLAPWHRVISGVPDPAAVLARAARVFAARSVGDSAEVMGAIEESSQAGVMGLWTRGGGSVLQIDRSKAAPFVAGSGSEIVRRLDVSVLSGTLSQMIGTSEAGLTAEGRLSYTHDAHEAIRQVDDGVADVAFLMRPTPIGEVLAVAAAGEFMPPKSTYFYPKAATGLVFDPLF
jgi:uncharacterized protein (DUF1015 family)